MSAGTGLDPAQLDVLREVANIGAGHAATALSQLTGSPVTMTVPRVVLVPLESSAEQLAGTGDVVTAVTLALVGDVNGRALLLLDVTAAASLCRLLLPRPAGGGEDAVELERSALREVGNIVTGAYANALSAFLGLALVPSVPELSTGLLKPILSSAVRRVKQRSDQVLCLETRFGFPGLAEELVGRFILIPEAEALPRILRAVALPT